MVVFLKKTHLKAPISVAVNSKETCNLLTAATEQTGIHAGAYQRDQDFPKISNPKTHPYFE